MLSGGFGMGGDEHGRSFALPVFLILSVLLFFRAV
jgi:hypothetical protein